MQIQYFEQKVNMDIQRYIFAVQNTVVFCVWLVLYGREGNGTHSGTLAWKIPRMEEPGGLQSMGLLGVRHD